MRRASPRHTACPQLRPACSLAALARGLKLHQLASPPQVADSSYYAVIVSIWTTQLHYDIRYEGDDAVHRLLKPLHLVLFVYIGAASGGWDLSRVVWPQYGKMSSTEAVEHDLAGNSFLTVAIAVALHRALLVAQYIMSTSPRDEANGSRGIGEEVGQTHRLARPLGRKLQPYLCAGGDSSRHTRPGYGARGSQDRVHVCQRALRHGRDPRPGHLGGAGTHPLAQGR